MLKLTARHQMMLDILLSGNETIHSSVGPCGLLWAMFAQIDFFAHLCSLGSRLSENQGCPIFQPR